MQKRFFLFLTSVNFFISFAHSQTITLEDIWAKQTFRTQFVPGFNFMNDGQSYSTNQNNVIKRNDIQSGNSVEDIFDGSAFKNKNGYSGIVDDYLFSEDDQKILIGTDNESIYRRSSLSNYFLFDRKTKSLTKIWDNGKIRDITFSPDAKKIAFCHKNNLYFKEIGSEKTVSITTDGVPNKIINGTTDWVYEEEFEFTRFYEWSADGKYIAYVKSDETNVPEFTMTHFKGELYPDYETFKYPKVGENNSKVQLFIYNTDRKKTTAIDLGKDFEYIPRLKATKDPNKFVVFKMNRHQNLLQLILVDASSGKTSLLMEEKSNTYIEINDDITFLKDGKSWIWSSERSGFRHLYLYDMEGKMTKQLTKGEWEITAFYGYNEQSRNLFYQSTEAGSTDRLVYRQSIDNPDIRLIITEGIGWHEAQFNKSLEYFIHTASSLNMPPMFHVSTKDGLDIRPLERNDKLAKQLKDNKFSKVEIYRFETSDKLSLNCWMIKPPNFDPKKKYPVFMTLYGGPGSQQASNKWMGANYFWYQLLANNGYIVACVDNRGTGGKGENFKKCTYLQLGKYETQDQIEGAKYLASQPFVDKDRIGIFGWSYGGFMSSLCLLKGNDVFKAAIAVAPVISWRWYDSIYTERYMKTEKENPSGYKENSPVYFADQLKGKYLLVHGMGDDNVHFQNAAEMVNALVKANKQFESLYYPNRNHGIYGGNTRLHLFTKMTDFIYKNL